MSIGSRIKEARLFAGLSRNGLALRIGVTPSAISNYENDISSPRVDILHSILSELNVDANYVYQDSIPINRPATHDGRPVSPEVMALIKAVQGVTPKEAALILHHIEYVKSQRKRES
jgi:transcriptional regulator with XRE-family HTH domain